MGLVSAMVQGPAPDRPADGLQRFRADRRQKAMRGDMTLPHRFPGSEREAEKVERLVGKVSSPVRILAVDELRLPRMHDQLAGGKTGLQRTP